MFNVDAGRQDVGWKSLLSMDLKSGSDATETSDVGVFWGK